MSETNHIAEFKDWGKTERLRKLTCLVTEKIDGTNAQIYVPADPSEPVLAGARNGWVTPEKDNAGFARFVYENAELFRLLGPGRHYGEWYGAGIQRRYGLGLKRLALFNVDRFSGGLPAELLHHLELHVHLVPVLYRGPLDTAKIAEVTEALYTGGSIAVPGYMQPEGVVVQFGGSRYKITDNGDEHKGMTTKHSEVVQAAAAKDRSKREATEGPLQRALKLVSVGKKPDDPEWFVVGAQVQTDKLHAIVQTCRKERIGEVRREVAQALVDQGLVS